MSRRLFSQLTIAGSRWSKNCDDPGVHRGDAGHLVIGQGEVEDVEVLFHALAANRLGDGHDAALDQPAEHDLGDGLAVGVADGGERRIGEQVVASLGEPAPRLDLHAVGVHQLVVGVALEERVRLDLVDRRGHVVVLDEIDETVRVEVGDTDRPGQAVGVELLHRPPEAVVVPERLVDQVQVDVVETEPLQRPLEGRRGVGLAGVLDPQLGRHEQLVTSDAAAGDGPADSLLVPVRGCRVDQPVADLQGSGDGLLGLLRRDLIHAETKDRHLDTIVQRDTGNAHRHTTTP